MKALLLFLSLSFNIQASCIDHLVMFNSVYESLNERVSNLSNEKLYAALDHWVIKANLEDDYLPGLSPDTNVYTFYELLNDPYKLHLVINNLDHVELLRMLISRDLYNKHAPMNEGWPERLKVKTLLDEWRRRN